MQVMGFIRANGFLPSSSSLPAVDITRAIFHYIGRTPRRTVSARVVAVQLIIKLQDALITGLVRDVVAILRNWSIIDALKN